MGSHPTVAAKAKSWVETVRPPFMRTDRPIWGAYIEGVALNATLRYVDKDSNNVSISDFGWIAAPENLNEAVLWTFF